MRKDARQFIRHLKAVGLTLESTWALPRPARRQAASQDERTPFTLFLARHGRLVQNRADPVMTPAVAYVDNERLMLLSLTTT